MTIDGPNHKEPYTAPNEILKSEPDDMVQTFGGWTYAAIGTGAGAALIGLAHLNKSLNERNLLGVQLGLYVLSAFAGGFVGNKIAKDVQAFKDRHPNSSLSR